MQYIKHSFKYFLLFMICYLMSGIQDAHSYTVTGPYRIKWLRVGSLRSWYASAGCEIEYGRRGNAGALGASDQTDGLAWPAQFLYQEHEVGKAFRLGTTNYTDPITGASYPHKVVGIGQRDCNTLTYWMPYEFKLIGKAPSPLVLVDNAIASDNALNDEVDEFDPNLVCDRMIINKLHSSVGVDMVRKIYAFTNQNHDNYFIHEYVFTNTGIRDLQGTQVDQTLNGVFFQWQYRLGFADEANRDGSSGDGTGWALTGSSWGLNTINDAFGQDPNVQLPYFSDMAFHVRGTVSWYGPHSQAPSWADDVGAPDHTSGRALGATAYAGIVTLHADKSPQDHSDNPLQPTGTRYLGSDRDGQGLEQTVAALMTQQYEFMAEGHPAQTQAEQIGNGFADQWGGDAGGYSSSQAYGPYTLAPGDSIKIVFAEGVCGINRRKMIEIVTKWFNNDAPFVMPDGSTTNDRNEYKNAWVWSGKDSLYQTYKRAIENYQSGMTIPQPPPAPEQFVVESGGDKISLSWAGNAESAPNFDGYEVYRAIGSATTFYDKIFSCNKSNSVTSFDDKTARRGIDYYYYVVSKDNGSTNTVKPGVPLVSSKYYTMTNTPARLLRPAASKLDEIRVVPNPYNINARYIQFREDAPDRLAFFGLPPMCTIKIFTERGDLIETIEHTNGSGDETWESVTSSKQIVVSGLYIAYFEVSEDYRDPATNELLFKKGDHAFRKFVIVR
ncbi:hypothetical protein JW960_10635 [candidate division KSB1 bacterium]|nr:hypothetical protein [candidate division KSB1 bacterium]